MTRRLILTRHAKSSWESPGMADHDRPLNPRGLAAAKDLGGWLASRGYVPDEVLCSAARRTCETWDGIAPALPGQPRVHWKETLYHAGADVMMAVLRHAEGGVVLMLGHNPGIAEFAHRLVVRPPLSPDFQKYPTGATLVCDFEIDAWSDAAFGAAVVVDFIVPREIG